MIIKRESRTGSNDLQVVYRPCKIDEMIGQETNKNIIRGNLDSNKVPHSYLFTGPPGCGKTTCARIVALGLNCENTVREDKIIAIGGKEINPPLPWNRIDGGSTSSPCLECTSCKSVINHNSMDVMEVNVGAYGNKGDVLAIIEDLPTAPFSSRYRVLIMDEAHKLTGPAQDALLKIIEDGFDHVYFIFCTNEPHKLKAAFIERCNVMNFGRISIDLVYDLLKNVSQFEGIEYDEDVLKYLADESEGVPRRVLVWLKQVVDEGSWTLEAAKQITGVLLDETDPQVMELSRILIKGQWKKSLELYKKLEKLPAETIRIAVAGFFVGCLKRSRTFPDGRKFSKILDIITVPIYESGKLGRHKFYNYMFKVVDLINNSKK